MKKLSALLALASLLSLNAPVYALRGGPFDNGAPPGTTADGTYSAVLNGRNLTGTVIFGISSNSETNGRAVIFHKGIVSIAATTAVLDRAAKRLAGAFIGFAALPGEAGASVANVTVTNAGTVSLTNQALTARGAAEGAFDASVKGDAVIVFEGKGELSTAASLATVINTGTSATTFNTLTNLTGTATTTTEAKRETTSFRIRGSRTSNSPFTSLNNITGTAARARITPVP